MKGWLSGKNYRWNPPSSLYDLNLHIKNPIVEIAMLSFHAYSGDRDEVQKVHGHLISWELAKAALI